MTRPGTWAARALLALLSLAAGPALAGPPLERLRLSQLEVTEGPLEEISGQRLRVSSDRMRAVARTAGQRSAELRFTYLGPTKGRPLQSGELRRQIGLKLLANDTCNLLYVMWRIEPEAKLVVSVKRNFGSTTHAECMAYGYQNLRPRRWRPVPAPALGAPHTLRADLSGQELVVLVDGVSVWEGKLGAQVLGLDGPAGMRSDNGRFELQLFADVPSRR